MRKIHSLEVAQIIEAYNHKWANLYLEVGRQVLLNFDIMRDRLEYHALTNPNPTNDCPERGLNSINKHGVSNIPIEELRYILDNPKTLRVVVQELHPLKDWGSIDKEITEFVQLSKDESEGSR